MFLGRCGEPYAVRRLNKAREAAAATSTRPTHQARAVHGSEPTGVPKRRPLIDSTTGVTGWWRAKPWSKWGMVAILTKALLGYGRKPSPRVKPAAASGEPASRPRVAATQE